MLCILLLIPWQISPPLWLGLCLMASMSIAEAVCIAFLLSGCNFSAFLTSQQKLLREMCCEQCCFADMTPGHQSSDHFSSRGYNFEANPVKIQRLKTPRHFVINIIYSSDELYCRVLFVPGKFISFLHFHF